MYEMVHLGGIKIWDLINRVINMVEPNIGSGARKPSQQLTFLVKPVEANTG
jgi:hypothetical protein